MKNGGKLKRNSRAFAVREGVENYRVEGSVAKEKKYDLEERTYEFARSVRAFVKWLPRTICNIEDVKQLVRASGSVGANYIEANESLGNKDFMMKIKISRKEAKEARFFLRLVDVNGNADLEKLRAALVQESEELTKIFGSIFRKVQ